MSDSKRLVPRATKNTAEAKKTNRYDNASQGLNLNTSAGWIASALIVRRELVIQHRALGGT